MNRRNDLVVLQKIDDKERIYILYKNEDGLYEDSLYDDSELDCDILDITETGTTDSLSRNVYRNLKALLNKEYKFWEAGGYKKTT